MKKVLLLTLIALMGGAIVPQANAHEFKNEKLKDFYGNARVYFGYQLGMNENNISPNAGKATYTDLDGKRHKYDVDKKTNHALEIGAGYNLYYKGFSKKYNPFVGAKAQINIPLYSILEESGITGALMDITKGATKDNVKYVSKNSKYAFNVLEISGKMGTKINVAKNIDVEPYIGVGKMLSVIKTSNVLINATETKYINSKGEEQDKYTRVGHTNTVLPTFYTVGADVLFNVSKRTFVAGLEYKYVDFYQYETGGDAFTTHYLTFNIGYQFL